MIKLTILFWQLLRRSRIFNYWYKKFLNELLYDLQLFDLSPDEVMSKYESKLRNAQDHKASLIA